jgi:hypothetical protein
MASQLLAAWPAADHRVDVNQQDRRSRPGRSSGTVELQALAVDDSNGAAHEAGMQLGAERGLSLADPPGEGEGPDPRDSPT